MCKKISLEEDRERHTDRKTRQTLEVDMTDTQKDAQGLNPGVRLSSLPVHWISNKLLALQQKTTKAYNEPIAVTSKE